MNGTLQQRFDAKVTRGAPGECWLWHGAKNNRGYGQLYDGTKVRLAHRLSYAMYIGAVPDDIGVLHRCDVPACVNPEHLFLGSHDDNMKDMAQKGRANRNWKVRGSDATPSRLSQDQVLQIRARAAAGEARKSLAAAFGVTVPAIGYVVRRDVWKHI